MVNIRDKSKLVNNGGTSLEQTARSIVLKSLESAVEAADPKKLLHSNLFLDGSLLKTGSCRLDLAKFNHVYVVGGGKAGAAMVQALEESIGEYITSGFVNIPYNTKQRTRVVELNEASHPIPDQAGVKGTRRMLAIAKKAKRNDLIICLISGGGSSLMPLPRKGVSLKDKRAVTEALLRSGAPINEVNVVRKHLSAFKGGLLAKAADPATVLNIVLSDVIGDQLASIASGPTVADPSTFGEAVNILQKYDLWGQVPSCIRKVLSDGVIGLLDETPKPFDPAIKNVCSVVIGNNRTACLAALDSLKSDGLNTFLVKKPMEGEAKIAGEKLAARARRVSLSGKPVCRPAGIVAGGETTVKVFGKGKGGRNQEIALASAISMGEIEGCVVASLSTDGIDGPTDAAGAIVDGSTLRTAKQMGLNAEVFLADNDSYSFHERLGNLIKTGATGTNVNDITVIVLL
ncbi:MAG TPA: glycerate kinase [Candidatus Nanoarchaeia archaeon]|nr:glycerate kinase [Candidatus Nanoarchaeia archaeon]